MTQSSVSLYLPSSLRKFATATSVFALGFIGSNVAAQDAADDEEFSLLLEEVVVTANKREQSLQDVGIAITAFSGDQLRAFRMENSIDIIDFTPGVTRAGDLGGQRSIFAIRGVVQNDYADHAEAPVAVYIDDSYLANTQAQTFAMFDMNRVEVLKGPQGTLFGRNATGGLVHSITNRPTEHFEGYADFTYASYDQTRFEATVSGPLSKKVTARLSAMYNHQGEILENVYTGTDAQGTAGTPGGGQDGYNDDTLALRAQMNIKLSDAVNVLLAGNYAETTKSEGPYQHSATVAVLDGQGRHRDTIYAVNDPNNCEAISLVNGSCINLFADNDTDGVRPVAGGDLFGYIDPDGSGNQVSKDYAFEDENHFETKGISAKLNWDFSWGSLFYMADFKDYSRSVGLDSDQSPTPLAIFQAGTETSQMSHELRLNGENEKFRWVTGLYYLDISADMYQGLAYGEGSPFLAGFAQQILGLDGVVLDPFEDNTFGKLDTKSYSIFGQVDYKITDKLTLVAGFRGGNEDKEYAQTIGEYANTDDRVVETETPLDFVPRAPYSDSQSKFIWSGKLQLEYVMRDGVLAYAGVNRGVKAGSYNAKLFDGTTLADDEIPYDEEVLVSYEAGLKADFWGGRARLNAAAFYYDYKDFQAFTWVNNSGFVSNNDAEIKGAEVELTVNPMKGLNIITGISYTDATVKDVTIAPDVTRDVTPTFTPKWQASAIARYGFEGLGGWMTAQAAVYHQSSYFVNLRNFTAHKFDGYTKANLRLTWADEADLWNVSVFADNVFDNNHKVIGFDVSTFGGYTQESYAKPRWIGVSVRRNF